MTRALLVRWLLFAAVAAIPAAGAGAVAWSARKAAIAQAEADEAARLAAAARSAADEIAARIADAKERARTMTEPGEGLAISGADPIVLEADGRLRVPKAPSADAAPSPACERAREELLGPDRARARDEIVAECLDLKSSSRRYLWPLLALEQESDHPKLPGWLRAHAARLGPEERAVLRGRASALASPTRERALSALDEPPSMHATLETLLARGDGEETSDGALRVRRGKYVAVLHAFDASLSGSMFHASSLVRDPPKLPDDLSLVPGPGGAPVEITSELVLHVAPKSEAAERGLITRAGNRVFALAAAGTLASLVLAGVLFERLLRARQLAELRTDFVAAVSHELRTPLASVQMFAELLERGDVSPDERPEVEGALAREARRLSETLTRMLRFGALSRGKLQIESKRQRLEPIAREALVRFERAHTDTRALLEADPTLEADVDATLLGLVLDNLLGNAAKYAPEGTPYRVVVERAGGAVRLSVSDRGPGLDRKARARVFLPFERADDRLARATEGTGVGLALVRGIAEAHGGRARVESEPGKGASFIVEIPWKPS
ncbi:MAG TPA: HAMP domain-containing sensor histidine kinase [Polyangiaceae bacterium]|nr:HAMP domain-containing sensor histidine kinase [Polyangiaceae bacterium]